MDDLVFAGQIGEQVQDALNDLSPQERAAFLMRHYHGCSIEEICEALESEVERRQALDFPGGEEDARGAPAVDGRARAMSSRRLRVTMSWHPTDDDLILHFYGERRPTRRRGSTTTCARASACQRRVDGAQRDAEAGRRGAVPEPPAGFERVMWAQGRSRRCRPRAARSFWTLAAARAARRAGGGRRSLVVALAFKPPAPAPAPRRARSRADGRRRRPTRTGRASACC